MGIVLKYGRRCTISFCNMLTKQNKGYQLTITQHWTVTTIPMAPLMFKYLWHHVSHYHPFYENILMQQCVLFCTQDFKKPNTAKNSTQFLKMLIFNIVWIINSCHHNMLYSHVSFIDNILLLCMLDSCFEGIPTHKE